MSDNVSKMDFQQPNTILRRVLLFMVLLFVVVGVVALIIFQDEINFDELRRTFKYMGISQAEQIETYSFDAHSSNVYASFDDGLAVASVSGIRALDKNGRESRAIEAHMSSPAIRASRDAVLSFDVGGLQLRSISKNALVEINTEKGILDADVSDEGFICYSVPEPGYKSVIYVLRADGSVLYRWLSASRYMPICTVSRDGEYFAAISLGQEDGVFQSTMDIFKTDTDSPIGSIGLGSELIYDLEFLPDGTLCSIGENSVMHLETDGTVLGKYEYNGAYLRDYDADVNGNLVLCLNRNRTGSRFELVHLAPDGQMLGTLAVSEDILDISTREKYTAVLTANEITVYNSAMELYAQTDNSYGAADIVMRADGSSIVISGGSGMLYVP